MATGFTRCGVSTSEGGSIEAELLATYAKEHVETNATTFMGLTLGCCACHDHKFDPLSQKEFYQFSAFFRNTTQKGIGPRTTAAVPPFIRVPAKEDEARWNVVSKQMDDAQAAVTGYLAATGLDKNLTPAGLLQKLAARPAVPPVSTAALELELPLRDNDKVIKSTQGVAYQLTGKAEWAENGLLGPAPIFDGTDYAELGNIGDFDTADAFSYGVWIRVKNGAPSGAVFARMDRNDNFRGWDLWLEKGKPTASLINFWPRNAIKQVADKPLTAGVWQHVFVTYDGSAKAAGLKIYVDGEPQAAKPEEDSLTESIRSPAQFTLGRRSGGQGAPDVVLQDLRVYRRVLSPEEIKRLVRRRDRAGRPRLSGGQTFGRAAQMGREFSTEGRPEDGRPPAGRRQPQGRIRRHRQPQPGHDGHGRQADPGVRLRAQARAVRPARRKGRTRRAEGPAAAAAGRAEEPARPRAMARRSGQPAAFPRDGEPFLAAVLRRRHRPDRRGFRHHGRASGQPAAARLAGRGVPRIRLGREAHPAPDGHLRRLPAIRPGHAGKARQGPGKPPRLARPPLPDGRRDDPRPGAGGERPARAENRRPQRQALPAAGPVGSRLDDQRGLQARPRATGCTAAASTRIGNASRRTRS